MGRITRATTIANSKVNTARRKPTSPRRSLLPKAHAQTVAGVPVTTEHIVTKSTTKTRPPKPQIKSKKEPLEGKNLASFNVHTQIMSRHTQNQGSHNYHGFTPLHGDSPHNGNWSLGSDDLKGISGRTKRINEQRVGGDNYYNSKQQGSHLNQSQYITPEGKTGIIETVIRSKTGFRSFGMSGSYKPDGSPDKIHGSLSPSKITKEKVSYADKPINIQHGMNYYVPASDTKRRAIDKKYYPDKTATGKKRTPLGKFALGVGNEAQDIGGGFGGLITGQDYKPKSILSRATDHAFAGDWDSAGKVISDNPYRFAGNVATNIGIGMIPFGMVARGAGLAGKAGKVIGKLKGKGATVPGRGGPIKKSGLTPDSQGNWVPKPASWPLSSAKKAKKPTKKPRPAVYDRYGNNIEDSIHYF